MTLEAICCGVRILAAYLCCSDIVDSYKEIRRRSSADRRCGMKMNGPGKSSSPRKSILFYDEPASRLISDCSQRTSEHAVR